MNHYGNAMFPMRPMFNQPNQAQYPAVPFNPRAMATIHPSQMPMQAINPMTMPRPQTSTTSSITHHSQKATNPVGQKTNASDMFSRQSRVFVGSVSPKLSREQLIQIFNKHGNVSGLSLLKGFAFVQYDSPKSAQIAVSRENGKIYGGCRFECNVVANEKKPSPVSASGTGRGRGQNQPGSTLRRLGAKVGSGRIKNNAGEIVEASSNLKRIAVASPK